MIAPMVAVRAPEVVTQVARVLVLLPLPVGHQPHCLELELSRKLPSLLGQWITSSPQPTG